MYDSQNPEVLSSVPSRISGRRSVILTFDDGPSRVLPEILDILKDSGVPAVFFWQSRLLHKERPWKRVIAEGHKIGTHTVNHRNLTDNMTKQQQYDELKKSSDTIERITGESVKFFRPPYGQFNVDTLEAAGQLNLQTVMWRVASMDWELKDDPDQIITNIVDHLEDGAILLLHELRQTVQILPQLIAAIQEQGYDFATLETE